MKLELLANLSTLYSEPHRKYHNLQHIHYCLRQAKEVLGAAVPLGIHHAIWFHDAVYDPYAAKGTNENNSFSLYDSYYHSSRTEPFFPEALACIEATKCYDDTSKIDELVFAAAKFGGPRAKYYFADGKLFQDGNYEGIRKAVDLFLDIDFSILGDTQTIYHWYSTNIRAEYYMTNDIDYAVGRKAFLEKLLENKIYRTEQFAVREEQAQKNIKREIQSHTSFLNDVKSVKAFDFERNC